MRWKTSRVSCDIVRPPRSLIVASCIRSNTLAFLLEIRLDVGEKPRISLSVISGTGVRSASACAAHEHARHLEQQADLALVGALEHRRLGVEAEDLRDPPEVGLEDLTDVHSASVRRAG